MMPQFGPSGDDLLDAIDLAWAWPIFLGSYIFAFGLAGLGVIAAYERSNVGGAALLTLLGLAIDGLLVWALGSLTTLSMIFATVALLPSLLAIWSFKIVLWPDSRERERYGPGSKVDIEDRTSDSTGAASSRSLAPLGNPYSPPDET